MYQSIKNNLIIYSRKTYSTKDIFQLAFILLVLNTIIALVNSLFGLDYPHNTFLIWPRERFGDLLKVVDGFQIANTWEGLNCEFVYFEHLLPLPSSFYFSVANIISLLENKNVALLILFIIIVTSTIFLSRKSKNNWSLIFLSLCSYPMIFALDRGNLAIGVFLLLFLSMTTESLVLASLAIALATSIKLTPILFIVPVLLRKPLSIIGVTRTLLFFFTWLVLVNFLAIQFNGNFIPPYEFDPLTLLTSPIHSYNSNHVNTLQGLSFGSSLYMPIAYISNWFILTTPKSYEVAVFICVLIGCCLFLKKDIIPTFHRLLNKKNMLYVICLTFILLMPVTGDYYLLILLIPLLLYPATYFSFGYFLAYGLVLSPKNIFFLTPTNFLGNVDISLQVFINPLLLLILLMGEFNILDAIKRDQSTTDNRQLIRLFNHIGKQVNGALKSILGPAFLPIWGVIISALNKFRLHIKSAFLSIWGVIISAFNKFKLPIKRLSLQFIDFIRLRRKIILITSGVLLILWIVVVRVKLVQQRAHNIEIGLPIDFDPDTYLELNPQLEEFWNSKGIYESGQKLRHHAEEHYKGFGKKDDWKYK